MKICFGNKILTKNGYKSVEEISLKDQLITQSGSYQKIIGIRELNYRGFQYKLFTKFHHDGILFADGESIGVRNRVKIRGQNMNLEMMRKGIEEIRREDFIGMIINSNSRIPKFLANRDEYFYMIGYFMGNGWLETYSDKFEIYFTISDWEVERKIGIVLPIRLDGYFWCENMQWYNILKDFVKGMPEWIQDLPQSLVKSFIDGYEKSMECKKRNHLTREQAIGLQRLYLKIGRIVSVQLKNGLRIIKEPKRTVAFIDGNYVWYPITRIEMEEVNMEIKYLQLNGAVVMENMLC